jgi:hypothetical protein
MLRLIKDWSIDGVKISKGISFKELPKSGIFSNIPIDYFEEFVPTVFVKKKRAKIKELEIKSEKSTSENARISDKKI